VTPNQGISKSTTSVSKHIMTVSVNLEGGINLR